MTDTLTREDADGAFGMAAAVATGRRRSADLVDAAIARIEAGDGAINAVVVRDFERARAAAQAADAAVAAGDRRPLLGVPMTVKESFNVAGLPTHWGLPPFKDVVAREDALAIQRLKAAGAVILGKTNIPPALADWQTGNAIHGRTVNPLDHARSPGGSSGGSAAALAAGYVPLELGSDIGGSIRVPAAFCGVCGHKPSYGLIPTRGHDVPGSESGAPAALAVIGPLARSARDLEQVLPLLAGADPALQAVTAPLAPPRHARLKDFRVLVLDRHPVCATDKAVRTAVNRLGDLLSEEGAQVERGDGRVPDLAAAHRTYVTMLQTAISRGDPNARPPISAHAWMEALDVQARVRMRWAALFGEVDVVLAPTFGTVAFTHQDDPDWGARRLSIDGEDSAYGDQLAWPGVALFGHLPATAFPFGTGEGGMPVGLQAIGPYLEDLTTLRFASLVEDAFGRG